MPGTQREQRADVADIVVVEFERLAERAADRRAVRIGQGPVEPPVVAHRVEQHPRGRRDIEAVHLALPRCCDDRIHLRAEAGCLHADRDPVGANTERHRGGGGIDVSLHQQRVGTGRGQGRRVDAVGGVARDRHQASGGVQQPQRHAGPAGREQVQPVACIGGDREGLRAIAGVQRHGRRRSQGQRRRGRKIEQAERIVAGAGTAAGDDQPVGPCPGLERDRLVVATLHTVGVSEGAVVDEAGGSEQLPGDVAVAGQRIRIQQRALGQREGVHVLLERYRDRSGEGLPQCQSTGACACILEPEREGFRGGFADISFEGQQVGAGGRERQRPDRVDVVRACDQLAIRPHDPDVDIGPAAQVDERDHLARRGGEAEQLGRAAGVEGRGHCGGLGAADADRGRRGNVEQAERVGPGGAVAFADGDDVVAGHQRDFGRTPAAAGIDAAQGAAGDDAAWAREGVGAVVGRGEVIHHHDRLLRDVEAVMLDRPGNEDRARDGRAQRHRGFRAGPGHRGDRHVVDGLHGVGVIVLAADREAAGAKLIARDEQLVDGPDRHAACRAPLGCQHDRDERAPIGLRDGDGRMHHPAGAEVQRGQADELLRHQAGAGPDGDVVAGPVAAIVIIDVERDAE